MISMCLYYRFIMLLTAFLVAACANPYQVVSKFEEEDTKWAAHLGSTPGRITITAHQARGTRWIFSLPADSRQRLHPPLKVIFSDDGCSTGHKIIIEYIATEDELYREYFDLVIPWQESFTFSVAWGKEGKFSVTANEESLMGKVYRTPSFARISSSGGHVNIVSIDYSKVNADDNNI